VPDGDRFAADTDTDRREPLIRDPLIASSPGTYASAMAERSSKTPKPAILSLQPASSGFAAALFHIAHLV